MKEFCQLHKPWDKEIRKGYARMWREKGVSTDIIALQTTSNSSDNMTTQLALNNKKRTMLT